MNKVARVFAFFAVSTLALTILACEAKQTKEAEMPEVKVEGGQAPEFEVETAEVTVEEKEIEIPDTVKVPDVDVTMPGEKTTEGTEESAEMPTVSEMTPAESELEMAPSVEPESETTPAELEMAPSVEPESETTPAESKMTPSVE